MISKKHNCIFIHIPKTGGTSIEHMIWSEKERTKSNLCNGYLKKPFSTFRRKKLIKPNRNKHQLDGLQHLLAKQVKKEVPKKFFNQALKFTMVRNPWDRVISQYMYMFTRKDLMDYIDMDEDTELIKYLELIGRKKHPQWEKQHEFFCDAHGEIIVDQILRFENFNLEISKVLTQLNIELNTVLHRNKGNRRHYSEYYNSETKEFVADMYSQDIELLGYSYSCSTSQSV